MVKAAMFGMTYVLIPFILEFGITSALQQPSWRRTIMSPHTAERYPNFNSSAVQYYYATAYTDEIFPMDHFAYNTDHKFRLKYLYNTSFYRPGGPVLFVGGGQGKIEHAVDGFDIVWDIAPNLNAAVIFVEHRYYGASLPYNDFNTTYKHLGYLSSLQALADFSVFLPWVKQKLELDTEAKVVAFGGGYGGMLAAWFRLKYPTLTVGAWAAAAPVLYFNHTGVSIDESDHTLQQVFIKMGCDSDVIVKALNTIWRLPADDLNRIFKIKDNVIGRINGSRSLLYSYIERGLKSIAVLNYPYPLNPMQSWPAALVCQQFSDLNISSPETELASALAASVGIYYNGTGQIKENDLLYDDDDKLGANTPVVWKWQECTEIIITSCSLGPPNDFFNASCNATNFLSKQISGCIDAFGDIGYTSGFMNPDAIQQIYGFDFSEATNIVFTNGELGIYSGGGVTNNTPGIANAQNRGIYNFIISGAAHNLESRQPNSCDPPSVVNARYQAIQVILCWLNEAPESDCPVKQQPLPVFEGPYNTTGECRALVHEWPWGQEPNI